MIKKESETIICNEAKQHYTKLNAQSLTSSNQSSITKPSNKEQQSSQATMLQNFLWLVVLNYKRHQLVLNHQL
ncbi:unnamed protein product [Rotaria magnacalcarata]|uniref:Uncharacterized protein n=2 Tax=Rotaria magnacalcarata TaxID=392030 RepID=A0A8S3K3Y6_9BILA|nr:unnamed protein product [Rotaria magnacalcarata]